MLANTKRARMASAPTPVHHQPGAAARAKSQSEIQKRISPR
jgi:hypothetical protein